MSRGATNFRRKNRKRDLKPYILLELKDAIYRLSFLTYTPVKDIAEQLIINSIQNKVILDSLSRHFKREIYLNNTWYGGHLIDGPISKRAEGECERITTRLREDDYEDVRKLAYALDCSTARAGSLLIEASMKDMHFINSLIKEFMAQQLSDREMKELRDLMKFLNQQDSEHHSWAVILSQIADEVSIPLSRLREAVTEFIKRKS